MHTLTADELHTEDARKLLRYVNEKFLAYEIRVAFQNKVAAHSYLGIGESPLPEDCA